MVAHGVGDVMPLGEWRHRDEGHAKAELIKAGALVGEWAGRVGCKRRAESFLDGKAALAFRASAWLFAAGRIRSIGAQSGHNSIGCAGATLPGARRFDVIVRTAMFIVGDKDDGVFPKGPVAHRVDHLGDKSLAALNVSRRMLVVFFSKNSKIRINKRNFRQRTCDGISSRLGQEELQRQEVGIGRGWNSGEWTKAAALRDILEIISPGDFVFVEQIEDGSRDRFVTGRRGRENLTGRQVAKS